MTHRFPVLCLILMLVGSGLAVGQGGDPEKLVRGMEKKLAQAKTLRVSFEAEHLGGGKGDFGVFKGTLTVAQGNKVHLDGAFWNDGKATDRWKIVSDGTNLKSEGLSKVSKPASKKLTDDYRSSLTHGGFLMVAFYVSPVKPKEMWATFKASDFKFERQENIGKRKTNVVSCKLTLTDKADFAGRELSETLWLDAETNLPLKRRVTMWFLDGKRNTFTESYSTFDLAPKVEAKLFELP
jgi:outer membrane lipoprotein-sorting protein